MKETYIILNTYENKHHCVDILKTITYNHIIHSLKQNSSDQNGCHKYHRI